MTMRMVVFDDFLIQTLLVFLRLTWNIGESHIWKDVAFVVCLFFAGQTRQKCREYPSHLLRIPCVPPH